MKKFMIMMAAILCFAVSANAQSDSKMAAGINLNVGVGNSYTNMGLGGKFQYKFAERWRGEASFNYFFKKDYVDMWDANIDVHFLIPVGESLVIYPLAGPTLRNATASVLGFSTSESSFGVNYGAGVEYPITDAIKVNLELKAVSAGSGWGTRGELSIGAAYCF